MVIQKSGPAATGNPVIVDVTESDIEEMFDRFDSGMADHCTANAIVLAVKRTLGGVKLRTKKAGRNRWDFIIGERRLPLPEEANEWMRLMSDGMTVQPFRFFLSLPPTFPFPESRQNSRTRSYQSDSSEVA